MNREELKIAPPLGKRKTLAVLAVLTFLSFLPAVFIVVGRQNAKAEKEAAIAAESNKKKAIEAMILNLPEKPKGWRVPVEIAAGELSKTVVLTATWSYPPAIVVNEDGRPHYIIYRGTSQSSGYGDGIEEEGGKGWIVTYDALDIWDPLQGGMLWGENYESPMPISVTIPAGVLAGDYALWLPGHYNDGGPVHPDAIQVPFKIVCQKISIKRTYPGVEL